MQRNSRETTAGASKRNGIRAKPQREHRNQGPVPPPRAPLRSATNSFTLNVRTPLCKHCLGNYTGPYMALFEGLWLRPGAPSPTEPTKQEQAVSGCILEEAVEGLGFRV